MESIKSPRTRTFLAGSALLLLNLACSGNSYIEGRAEVDQPAVETVDDLSQNEDQPNFDPDLFAEGWAEVRGGVRFDQDPSQFGATQLTESQQRQNDLSQFGDAVASVIKGARFDNQQQ